MLHVRSPEHGMVGIQHLSMRIPVLPYRNIIFWNKTSNLVLFFFFPSVTLLIELFLLRLREEWDFFFTFLPTRAMSIKHFYAKQCQGTEAQPAPVPAEAWPCCRAQHRHAAAGQLRAWKSRTPSALLVPRAAALSNTS